MSSESNEPVVGGVGAGRRVVLGRFLAAAAFVVPAVLSGPGAAMASACGPWARTTSGVAGSHPVTTVDRVPPADKVPSAGKPRPGVTSSPAPSPTPEARQPGAKQPGGSNAVKQPGSNGGKQPGGSDGVRQPGSNGGKSRNDSESATGSGRGGGRDAGRGGGKNGGRSGDTGRKDAGRVDRADDPDDSDVPNDGREAAGLDGKVGKVVRKPAEGWGRSG
ncbi:hypothetical protein [Streptosporangium sp. NPDC006007]|uniref:hypothetical protein n=1 Tax=Streptosporangium sp. NPDC006007 TaxID=3154575 RepID=UPI0033B4651E